MNANTKIAVIDYGVGNTHSVCNALSFLGYKNIKITDREVEIKRADALILPGVGAFDEAVKNLKKRSLDKILFEEAIHRKKPLLGICVGMQLLAEGSEENGWHEGLGWIKGKVKKLELPGNFVIPHVGWNNVIFANPGTLFTNTNSGSHYYFDHSYHFECEEQNVLAYCEYGIKITAAVQCENITGVQFHPEKSQVKGLKIFRSFLNSIT